MNRSKICYEVFLVPADNFITFFAVEISNVKIGFQYYVEKKIHRFSK